MSFLGYGANITYDNFFFTEDGKVAIIKSDPHIKIWQENLGMSDFETRDLAFQIGLIGTRRLKRLCSSNQALVNEVEKVEKSQIRRFLTKPIVELVIITIICLLVICLAICFIPLVPATLTSFYAGAVLFLKALFVIDDVFKTYESNTHPHVLAPDSLRWYSNEFARLRSDGDFARVLPPVLGEDAGDDGEDA